MTDTVRAYVTITDPVGLPWNSPDGPVSVDDVWEVVKEDGDMLTLETTGYTTSGAVFRVFLNSNVVVHKSRVKRASAP